MRSFAAILLILIIAATVALFSDWDTAPTETGVLIEDARVEDSLLAFDAASFVPEDCPHSEEDGTEIDLHEHVLTGEERTAVLHAHASGICAPSCYELR